MWIHEHKDWPTFTWDAKEIAPRLGAACNKVGRLLGKMEALGFDVRQEANLKTLTNDVVTSSSIEGENLGYQEVRSSIARKLGMDVADAVASGRDVDGVVEMMLDATQNYKSDLTCERLFGWHALLFPSGRSGLQKISVGQFRPESAGAMQVVSGRLGAEKIHFVAPEAGRVENEMQEFLAWLNCDPKGDPVINAAIAHFWFVTIHPFEDGNGRMARAIGDLMLARADGASDRFYSMSKQTEQERESYYHALEEQQRASPDITGWLRWFLDCLAHAVETANETLETVLFKAQFWTFVNQHPNSPRQKMIVNRMLDGFKGFMQTAKYAKIAKCSEDTALRDIRELVDRGVFVKNPGGGRSTSYRLISREEIDEKERFSFQK